MRDYSTITLCQPDGIKGCSACCGLMNHKNISRDNLYNYLANYQKRRNNPIVELQDNYKFHKKNYSHLRDATAHLCQFQGFIDNNRPGCTIHPFVNGGKDSRSISFYGETICENFLCPAHNILSADNKKNLVKLVDDWYFYTIAIIDPDTFVYILNLLEPMKEDYKKYKKKLMVLLDEQSKILNEYQKPVFYYSLGEYNLAKKNFSAGSMSEDTKHLRERLQDLI